MPSKKKTICNPQKKKGMPQPCEIVCAHCKSRRSMSGVGLAPSLYAGWRPHFHRFVDGGRRSVAVTPLSKSRSTALHRTLSSLRLTFSSSLLTNTASIHSNAYAYPSRAPLSYLFFYHSMAFLSVLIVQMMVYC